MRNIKSFFKTVTAGKKPHGFNLVELMITLVVIGVLAAIGIPAYQDYVTRARVSEALVFADAARTRVELPLIQGSKPQDLEKDLLGSGDKRVDMISRVQWVPATPAAAGTAPASGLLGFILVEMKLPGMGDAPVNALALQRTAQGGWICTGATKVTVPDPKVLPLDEKYLPATCHGDGTALAAIAAAATSAPATCPADQVMVTLTSAGKSHDACTPKCAAGQTRDAANPTQCNNSSMPNVPVAPVIPAQAATNSVAPGKPAGAATATPAASASTPATAAAVAKPVTPAAPAAAQPPAAAPVGTVNRPGAAGQAPLQCHTCDPAMPELCELVTVETTCTYPKNYCMTYVDNHADGSKEIKRYCGDYAEMYREWWLGTSDDDKCRMVDQDVPLDFRCTFACETPNCNQNGRVRPPEDALFRDR